MNLRQLEAFRATIMSGSITGAADLLHVSQPSISRLIADLERSVGFALFRRSGRGIVATVEARRFYQAVDSMFIGIDRLTELAETIRTTAGGVISIGVIPAFTHTIMPEAVGDLYRARPEVQITVHMRNTPSIVDAVRMQQFDLGIVGRTPPYAGVETLYVTSVPYVCLVPEDHPLAGAPAPLDLEKLAGSETFVTFGGAFIPDLLGMDPRLMARLRQNSRLSFVNMPVAASLARETGTLAIVDPYTARIGQKLGGVVSRPLLQDLEYNIAIVTKGLDTLSLEARELAEVFIEKLDESIDA